MIKFNVMWQDLNEEAKERCLKAFGDNCNWDVVPMTTLYVEDEKNILLDSWLGDKWDAKPEDLE